MSNYDLYNILIFNDQIYWSSILLSLLIYYILYRKIIYSVFDPIVIVIFSCALSAPIVSTLYLTHNIDIKEFSSFVLTEIALFLGIITFSTKRASQTTNLEHLLDQNAKIGFYYFSLIYIVCQVIVYKVSGIPIFMESRLDVFVGGTGYGIISRISEVSGVAAIASFFYCTLHRKMSLSSSFVFNTLFLLIFITFLLSGSKSMFMMVLNIFFTIGYMLHIRGYVNRFYVYIERKKTLLLLLCLAFVFILTMAMKRNEVNENNLSTSQQLLLRVIHFGDIYWYSYPNKAYLNVPSTHWIQSLLVDFLGFIKVIPWYQLPEHIGYQLTQFFHPSDAIKGANARYNVFGLVYFGYWGAIIYAYIVGLIIGFVRRWLYRINIKNYFVFISIVFLFIKVPNLIVDEVLFSTSLNNLLFVFTILFIGYYVLISILRVKTNGR